MRRKLGPDDRFLLIRPRGGNSPRGSLEVYAEAVGRARGDVAAVKKLIAGARDLRVKTAIRHMHDRVEFAREVLGFVPDPEQEAALRSWSKRLILNCNRQWGKSTIAAIRALHRAWFWPGSLILIVSRTQMHTGNLLEKVRDFLPALGVDKVQGDGVNRKSVKLPNGSRIVALPGGEFPTRSHSTVAMVIIDEAAMVPDAVHDAVAPTLGRTNGELVLSSTPMGKRGAFYKAWAYGGPKWERVFGPVHLASGRISEEHLEAERGLRGEEYFAQEYLCEFLDRDAHLFNEDSIQDVFDQDLQSWEETRR